MSMVGFAGSEVVFTCGTRNAPTVTWKVNGTYFSRHDPPLHDDWRIDPKPAGDIDINTLTAQARAEYNGTWVQCIASVPGGALAESENATLLVQGNRACSFVAERNHFHGIACNLQVYWLQWVI